MKVSLRSLSAALVLSALGAVLAFADSPGVTGVTSQAAQVHKAASLKSDVVAELPEGVSFRVLEQSAKDERVDGRKGRWLRVSTSDGIEGWLHGGRATVRSTYLSLGDFPDSEAYGNYLFWALMKGERVRAADDYEKVSKGDLGWYFSMDEGEPPILVVWDRDVDAMPRVDAIPKDCPRILSGRIYFVYPKMIEVVPGGQLADFDALASQWRETAAPEDLFPIGSRVILGEHQVVKQEDSDSKNWSEGMAEYVGKEAVVTGHGGLDPWDRFVVTVDVDGGAYNWRVENLQLLERISEQPESGDSDSDEESYSREEYDDQDYALEEAFPVGSLVILGRHKQIDSQDEDSTYWSEEMDQYVGQKAYITKFEGLCPWGEPLANVDLDEGAFYWRLADMELLEAGPGYYVSDDTADMEEDSIGDYGADSSGLIKPGMTVVLGRHDERNGGDNWVEDMDLFVGQEATISDILGTDSQGFMVVSVQGNDWSWRIRNLTVKDRGAAGSYGFALGDLVVLGRHRSVDGEENWNPDMESYVGKTAKIIELVGTVGDAAGCYLVRVDADQGKWVWRAESLTPTP